VSSRAWSLLVLSLSVGPIGCAADPPPTGTGTSDTGGVPVSGPVVGMAVATFDTDIAGFRLDSFVEAANLNNGSHPTPPTLAWDMTEGSPDPGCLKITAPYTGANQYVDLESPIFPMPFPDWSGKKLHVRIKVDPSSTFNGSPQIYVKTGAAYIYYPSAFTAYPASADWLEFTFSLLSPAPVPPATAGADPAQVITYGVHPTSGSSATASAAPVTFFVDSFSIE
jgi:hypothetical protein